jgi:hypothetical protein
MLTIEVSIGFVYPIRFVFSLRNTAIPQQLLSFVFKSKTSFEHFVARPTKTEKSVVLTAGYR